MVRGFRDFAGYIDERVQCYPFMNEMTGLYKGLIEIWDEAGPDDLSTLFYIADKTISNGFPRFDKERIVDIDFSNSVRTAKKIINLIEKGNREKTSDIKELSIKQSDCTATQGTIQIPLIPPFSKGGRGDFRMKEIVELIKVGLSRDDKYRNIVLKWILKPSFIYSLKKIEIDASSWSVGKCPLCYSPPGMAIVEGTIQQRYLSCCFCGYSWLYHLTGCPACGNISPERLSFFADGSDCEQGSRAVSCEECKTYIKTVFINCRTDGRGSKELDMDIEDVVTIPLDMIAHQRGYIAICQK